MWSLARITSSSNESENSDQTTVRLLVGKDYVVGRKDCPIIIKEDPSISRKHAVLNIQYDIANLADVSIIPEVTLSDTSKYGTAVNGLKITQPTKLNNGDEICFGTHDSKYRIIYTPLVAVTSCLETGKKKQLKKQIHLLGGHVLNEWKKANVTHLVMDGLRFTIKVIHALAECCHIVTLNLFDETIKAVEKKQNLPTPKVFLPPLKEESIKSDEPLFLPDNKRKSLLKGKTFFFISEKQFQRTHEAIEMCGASAVLLEPRDTFPHDRNLVKDESCVMMVDNKEREGLAMDVKKWITELMDFLKSKKKRPIPESELGLAVLQMTLRNYCNPNIDAVPAITQNLVCQSLNVGLDEMSQIYSPQNKQQNSMQFKKSSGLVNNKDENKPVSQLLEKSDMKPPQSTNTITPKRPIEAKSLKKDIGCVTVKDTPENAMKNEKPRQDEKVSPIPETLNISGDGNVFVADTPSKPFTKSTITSYFPTNNKGKLVVPESMGFDATRNHRESKTSIQEADTVSSINGASQRNSRNSDAAIPDSLSLNLTDSEIESEPVKIIDKRFSASTIVTSKEKTTNEGVIPDSVGFDIKHTQVRDIDRKESVFEQDPIPESMDVEENYSRISTSRSNSQTAVKKESESSRTNHSNKRRRITTEDADDSETENKKLPSKRLKNESSSGHEVELNDVFSEGLQRDVKVELTEERNENREDDKNNIKLQGSDEPAGLPRQSCNTMSNGFLTAARHSIKTTPKVTIKAFPVENGDINEINEDDLPRNLVVVEVTSLVVRQPGKRITTSTKVSGKNFKKFKKQWYAGCERPLPKIIGGSDLVVHQALANVRHEDWFIEAQQTTQEQERRDRMEEELFMSDVGLPQRRKRR